MNTLLFTRDGTWTLRDLKAPEAPRVLALLKEQGGDEALVARRFREGSVFMAERGGEDAGCMVVQMAEAQVLWISSFAVQPLFAGRGLDKALLDFAESLARARGRDVVRLSVLGSQAKLGAFAAAQGFAERSQVHVEGEALHLMEKTLR